MLPTPTIDPAAILDAVPDAVVVLDAAWRVTYVNTEGARQLGGPRERVIGRTIYEALPHLEGSKVVVESRAAVALGEERRMAYRSPRSGHVYDVRVRPYAAGAIVSVRELATDGAVEAAFRGMAEQSLTGISVIQDERFTYANPRYAEIFGYSVAELLALPSPLEIVHPDDRATVKEHVRRRVSGERGHVQYTVRGVRRGGAPVAVDVYGVAATFDGRPAMVATVLDVTERDAKERAMREANETLRTLIDTAPQAIVVVDLALRVTRWNAAAERLFGWTAEEIVGQAVPIVPESESGELQRTLAALRGPQEPSETRRRRKDGSLVDVFVSRAPLLDAEGRTTAYIAVITDATSRKALEEQLRQAQKMEAVGRLAGGVAHDFNNLLTVILSNADLAAAVMPGDAREELAEIRRAAERAGALTAQLLTVSRRQVVKAETLELNAVVREAERMLRRVVPESVVLLTDLAPDAGYVRADRGQLEQVLMNLVVNARDAMPPEGGTVFVRTARRGEATGARAAVLVVQDTGVGMDEATRSRVFEPFFTTKRAGEGTGLGLATVYGIVQQSGGEVRVESAPGAGATVTVRLPSVGAPGETPPDAEAAPVPTAAPGRTVMLVEDERAVRTVARRILERAGYRVLEATNGAEGLQLWGTHAAEVDVVVTDVVMPAMGGPALVERLTAERPSLPVVFMSGYADGALDGVATEGRRVQFLGKPFSPDGLLRCVGDAVAG